MATRIMDGGLSYSLSCVSPGNIDKDPLWSSRLLRTDPDAIKDVHRRFLKAGADIILTATYQASIPGFTEHLKITEQEACDLLKTGTRLARESCAEITAESTSEGVNKPLVAGSVGPYGACLRDRSEYTGSYIETVTTEELQAWHRPRIKALVESGVDLLALETIPAQREAEALIGLLQVEFPDTKAYVTYSCKDGDHTCHGELFSAAITPALQSDCVVGVGMNCTDSKYITSLLTSVNHQPMGSKALIVKPNMAGQNYMEKGWWRDDSNPGIHTFAADWLNLGASWLGGCCWVNPHDIARLREEVERWKSNKLP